MTEIRGPQTHVHFETRITIDKQDMPDLSGVYEGEIPMSAAEQDQVKALLGDGKASVNIRRGLGEMSYGNGGNCAVSITITCDQSQEAIKAAAGWASYFAESICDEELVKARTQIQRLGIVP